MPKKILVADDDFKQRELYADLFRNSGYTVVSAIDGLDALEKCLKEKPDLVFTGIIMPRMDGFELVHNLRKSAVTADVPVILFSHLGREEDHKKAQALANVMFRVKGFDSPAQILNSVNKILS